jgi:hypothetical protein
LNKTIAKYLDSIFDYFGLISPKTAGIVSDVGNVEKKLHKNICAVTDKGTIGIHSLLTPTGLKPGGVNHIVALTQLFN